MIEERRGTQLPTQQNLSVVGLDRLFRTLVLIGWFGATLLLVRSTYLVLSGERQFVTFTNVFLYFILPAVVGGSLLAALWLSPIARARVLLVCLSTALSAYVAELVFVSTGMAAAPVPMMTVVEKARDPGAFAAELSKTAGRVVDARTAQEVMAELRKADPGAIPVLTPVNHLISRTPDGDVVSLINVDSSRVVPLAGPSHRTTLLCNEDGRWVSYRSDRYGFNNPDETWDAASRIKVAVLGDSFAHGYCVPREESFPALLARQEGHVLNLGMAGDGPLMMLATLTEFLAPLKPGAVLWCYFEGNDLEDLQVEREVPLLVNYLQRGFTQPLLRRQTDLDAAMLTEAARFESGTEGPPEPGPVRTAVATVMPFMKLTSLRLNLGLITPTLPRELQKHDDFQHANLEVFREVLRQAKTRVAEWNGRLYFVYLPSWERYSTRYRSLGNLKRDEVLSLVSSLQLPIIDLDPAFRATGDPQALFPFRRLGHYTEAGQALVADTIQRRLALDRGIERTHPSQTATATTPLVSRASRTAVEVSQ